MLRGYLHEDFYQHHLLLVEAIYLLLKDLVEKDDISQSKKLFNHYCYLFPVLYGMFDCELPSLYVYIYAHLLSTFISM